MLSERRFLLGDAYSLADLIAGGCVAYGEMCGVSVARHASVGKWLDAFRSRPAFVQEWGAAG
jgi:glutathione S-transferase